MSRTKQDDGGQAFPRAGSQTVRGWTRPSDGMTMRQYAAIKLCVPDSGDEWLDDMIRKSRRDRFAGQALAGYATSISALDHVHWDRLARDAYKAADAMLEAVRHG